MKQNSLQFHEPGNRKVFKVPEKYFETFESQLEQRLDVLEKELRQPNKKIPSETGTRKFVLTMESVRPILYMAAMFVLLVFSIGLILNLTPGRSSKLSAEDKTPSVKLELTAEDYLISSVGTYGITQYYVDPESFD